MKTLDAHPHGLGSNELSTILSDDMSPVTLRKRLKLLEEQKFVKITPENPRRGQKIIYKSHSSWREYQEFIKRIDDGAQNTIELLKHISIKDVKDVKKFNDLYSIGIIRQFSLPIIIGGIGSWNWGWLHNEKIMTDVLLQVYQCFWDVMEEYEKIIESQELKDLFVVYFNGRKDELEKEAVKNPLLTMHMNVFDFDFFNLYKNKLEPLEKIGVINKKK